MTAGGHFVPTRPTIVWWPATHHVSTSVVGPGNPLRRKQRVEGEPRSADETNAETILITPGRFTNDQQTSHRAIRQYDAGA